jgi:cardiolipin synthase
MKPERRTRAAVKKGLGRVRDSARGVRSWSRTLGGRLWLLTIALGSILVGIIALVGFSAWFLQDSPVRTVHELGTNPVPTSVASPDFAAAVEIATLTELQPGTSVQLLNDGIETFPSLWRDLRAAKSSITIVNYFAADGAVFDTLSAILKERAAANVSVFFVYDPIGSAKLSGRYINDLKANGVRVAEYHPVRWYRLDRLQHRTHVRSIVIDGTIGYTGGFGFADTWLGDGESPDRWRDINARITGPAVRQLQAIFVFTWVSASGELLIGELLLEKSAAPDSAGMEEDSATEAGGAARSGIMISPATVGSSAAERLLALSLAAARRTLYISNAYFVPDDDFLRLLRDAVARGVDVRVLTNSRATDVPLTWYASRSRYEALLQSGVRIYEYLPTVLHSKVLVADSDWSVISTINFDNRSLAYNDEVSLLVLDPALGARMDSLFFDDLEESAEIMLDEFRRRSFRLKLLERGASLLSRWL